MLRRRAARRRFLVQASAGLLSARLHGAAEASLTVLVSDRTTGRQIPATVAIVPEDGKPLTDNDSYRDGIRSSGSLTVRVPPGRITVTVQRGFDYQAERGEVTLAAGQSHTVKFRLGRRTLLRAEGWICSDHHNHMVHGESRVRVDFPYVARAAAAEGLDEMSLAQSWRLREQSAEAVKHACDAVSTPECRISWNMEAPKNYYRGDAGRCLGHGWTLGLPPRDNQGRDVIATLDSLSAHDYEIEKRPAPNFETHAYIHTNGGIVSYTHPCRWWTGAWGGRSGYPAQEKQFISNLAAELPFDTIAGPTYDLLDILMQTHEREQNENALRLWFLLLNHGYRIPGTASSDTTFDNPGRGLPGAVRIYTRVPANGTLIAAMKSSRSFVTSGPLLSFRVAKYDIGASVPLKGPFAAEATLRLWASGAPGEYLTRAEIFRNGEVWRTYNLEGRPTYRELLVPINESEQSWYVVRCHGSNPRQVAISNPTWFDREPWSAPPPARALVRVEVRGTAGEPLNGLCEVVEFAGPSTRVLASHRSEDGRAEFEAPATARIRLRVEGREPQTKSLLLDDPQLLDPILAMRVANLLDWSTYEDLRRRLRSVRIVFKQV